MNFDALVVKESPGLCRCCLSEGCYKDLGTEYSWMNETEVYADMLLECFDISISQNTDGPNGCSRLICEVCITRLRDACNFKKQVLDSEKRFIDMVAKGEFNAKMIMYQAPMKCEEVTTEDSAEVEYLEEIDYEDDLPLKQVLESAEVTMAEDAIINEPVKVKGKRGRPRKVTAVVEKKAKLTQEKPRTSKSESKEATKVTHTERLNAARWNIHLLLHYGNVVPFQWFTRGYRCFYCQKPAKDCDTLKEHTRNSHRDVDLSTFIPQRVVSKDLPLKVDVADLSCKVCQENVHSINDLMEHVTNVHKETFAVASEVFVLPFVLTKNIMQCCLCVNVFDNMTSTVTHMYREHITHEYMCQICGLSFMNKMRMQRHITKSHVGLKCTICQKYFDGIAKLTKHKERIHGQFKTYQCTLCSETFENNYQIKVHMGKVHYVEKYRVKCEYCPKVTTTKGAMLLHVQSMHSNLKYGCDMCDYKCGIKWMIKLHKRKHFGEKNYVCTICQRKFGRSSNVRAHMKVHTGSFGRVCRWCKQGFTDMETLSKHERDVHFYDELL